MQAVKKRIDRLTVPVTMAWDGKGNRKHVLQFLLEKNNFTTMAEVGVRDGRTTFYLLDAIPYLKIFAIDTNISGFYDDEKRQKYQNRLVPLQGLSEHMADLIPDGSLDLVFIDANHGYEFVKKDIIKYTPKLKPTGLLTGHDIDYPGVNKAVREMIPAYDVAPNFVWIKKNESSTIQSQYQN